MEELMASNLLHYATLSLPDKFRQRNVIPLGLPFSVNPECAPYLVSGSKEPVIWVSEAANGKLHAAVRTEEHFEVEVVDAITMMGLQSEWGSIHPLTKKGLDACINHLSDYEITEYNILVNPSSEIDFLPEDPDFAEWAPLDCIIIVPKDRRLLGFVAHVLPGKIVSVIHNPSRAIAICRE